MLVPVVFLSGAVVMVLELVASRVLAPYLGTSLFVWTSLIGVILGSLSLGYWGGGRLADRRPEARTLALVLLAAAASVALIPALQTPYLAALAANVADLRWRAVAGALLFALPSALLGAVSPFAARLRLASVSGTGRTVGGLYAISTLGSIVGTFAAGFWLIPTVGSTRLVLVLALVLLVNSCLCVPRGLIWGKGATLLLWAGVAVIYAHARPALASGTLVLDRDTEYQRLLVVDLPAPGRRTMRALSMGFEEYHSGMFLDTPSALALPYTRFFRLGPGLRPHIRRALVLGGGAFSYPRDLLLRSPETFVDVVELDPGVTRVAREYFGLKTDPRLAIHHEDGRSFINRDGPTYDAVFLDVFWGRTVPFHLTTVEAARRVRARLSPDGLLVVNIISAIEGPAGEFLRAEYATLRRVFPQVLVFPVFYASDGARVQNVILVACAFSAPVAPPEGHALLYWSHLWRQPIAEDVPPLTDDFAPVERYTAQEFSAEDAQ